MAHRNSHRIDRFAQMSKQEEIIAKKRQEILEKQRTTQLAKAVAAAQSLAAKLKEGSDTKTDKEVPPTIPEIPEEKKETKCKKEEAADTPKHVNSLNAKTGKISFGIKRSQAVLPPAVEQPAPKVQNSFCNDGSFLDHFKKILEKHEQPKPPPVPIPEPEVTPLATTPTSEVSTPSESPTSTTDAPPQMQTPNTVPPPGPPPPPQMPPYPFNPNIMQPNMLPPPEAQQQPHALASYMTSTALPPPPQQPPPTHPMQTAFFAASQPPQLVPPPPPPTTTVAAVIMHGIPPVAPPPPPPPPQIPLALANLAPLYMIPAPEPLQLNAIPAPKEFDLNAIPKPQLNLEAIQMPSNEQQMQHHQLQQQQHQQLQQMQQQQQHQQHQQHHQEQQAVFSDNDHNCFQLPTTIENLIEMVAENGEAYEDQLRTHKNALPPAMWFLFDKNCEQYHNYRQQLNEHRRKLHHQQQLIQEHRQRQQIRGYPQEQNQHHQQQPPQQLQQFYIKAENNFNEEHQNAESTPNEEKYDPESVISGDVDSDDEYMRGMMDRNTDNIKRRIECRNELSEEERQEREAEMEEENRRRLEKKKMRKSRWGEKVEMSKNQPSTSGNAESSFGNQNKPILSTITRNDPALLQYARLNYGSTNLSEEEWKKCEEHYKVNLLYQDMIRKRQEIDHLARSGKFKYEYDSDEDVDGGTWEHKLRTAEMEATQAWAQALTKQSEGKHHIGDFLPPEELKKFMEQYEAKKHNRQPDLSDYKEYKLKEDNIGFQMLQKLGWKEGQGLGTDGAGIVDPVNKGPKREGMQGLGVANVSTPEVCDNEYDAYRKRMMLAYRFRPNPLNNPRRAYY